MEHTTTVTVRYWGARSPDGRIPYRAAEFLNAVQTAFNEIPEEYRDSAVFDADPDYEFGETYSALRLTYERPETTSEAEARVAAEREHWASERVSSVQRVAYCEAQLEQLGRR